MSAQLKLFFNTLLGRRINTGECDADTQKNTSDSSIKAIGGV
jgi:hypothetical protein